MVGAFLFALADEIPMLEFALNAMDEPDPFDVETVLPASVSDAIMWSAKRSAVSVIAEREAIICGLEKRAMFLRNKGYCQSWLAGADSDIKVMSSTVNGPLLHELADRISFVDKDCISIFGPI